MDSGRSVIRAGEQPDRSAQMERLEDPDAFILAKGCRGTLVPLERGTHYLLRGRSYRTRNHKEDLAQTAELDAA